MSNVRPTHPAGKHPSPFGTPVPREGAVIPIPEPPGWTVADGRGTEIDTIRKYLDHIYTTTAGSTDATVKTTAYTLLRLWRFLRTLEVDVLECTPEAYARYELWMAGDRHKRGMSLGGRPSGPMLGRYSTRTIKLSDAINYSFYAWLEWQHKGPLVNPVPPRGRGATPRRNPLDPAPVRRRGTIRRRGPEMDITPLTDDEQSKVLSAIRSPRDRCWYLLGLGPGARANEVITLTLDRIDRRRHQAHVVAKGRGGNTRPIPLTADFLEALDEYTDTSCSRGLTLLPDGPLWWTYDSGISPATYGTLQKAVRRIAARSGVDHHFHQLRHTAATRLMRSGYLSMEQIAYVLGHRSIATTRIYTHVDKDEAWAAFLKSSTEAPLRQTNTTFSVNYDKETLQAIFGDGPESQANDD